MQLSPLEYVKINPLVLKTNNYFYNLLLLLLLLLFTAIVFQLGDSSAYTTPDRTNKNKYT
jgi:hypothetical protein